MNGAIRAGSKGHALVGEGTLCRAALNFGPQEAHRSVYTEKPNSTALKTLEPPMGGSEEPEVFSPVLPPCISCLLSYPGQSTCRKRGMGYVLLILPKDAPSLPHLVQRPRHGKEH